MNRDYDLYHDLMSFSDSGAEVDEEPTDNLPTSTKAKC